MSTEKTTSSKKVAVIGAGASGLAGIKCCLDDGLIPVCFEKSSHIGGLWRYSQEDEIGRSTVMRSTIINTSKETMAFSDFPPPSDYPIYMHNTYVLKYFQLYAQEFDLIKHIQFDTEVVRIEKNDDFDMTGKWKVFHRNVSTSSPTQVEEFDGVLICTGHHAFPNIPYISGQEKFKGRILHSQQYKHSNNYEDTRVVVVGIGNSGGDIAVELSTVSSQVYLSTRRGAWILNRVYDKGFPIDMSNTKRSMNTLKNLLPQSISQFLIEQQLNKRFDHQLYGLKPEHSFESQHPTVSDDLPNRIISGRVKIKPDIKELSEKGVHFVDGSYEDVDVVILATGYQIKFPFVPESIVDIKDNKVPLFKYMFPPELKRNTLSIIGLAQPRGAIMPISELQCRIAARVIKGDLHLPSSIEMLTEIKKKEEILKKRYVQTKRHTIQVDFINFMDELADLCGCKPKLWKFLLVDPFLAFYCYFSSCTPYQYRLVGHGKWNGAKQALYQQWNRTLSGLNSPQKQTPNTTATASLYVYFLPIFFLLASFLFKIIF